MEKVEEGKWQGEYFGPLKLGVESRIIGGGSGLQGSSERKGREERDKNKTQEGKERREMKERTKKEGEQARLQREHQDTGAVCSQLCLEMNVTAMLTLANTPAPPQIQALGPAMAPRATSWSQDRRCRVECASGHNRDPSAPLEPSLSSSIPL